MSKTNTSPSPSTGSTIGAGCLVLFGLPFLASGLFLFVLYMISTAKALRARWWVEAPCTVEASNLESQTEGESETLRATARYAWKWDGTVYRSDRVAFAGGSDSFFQFQQKAGQELSDATGKPDGFHCWVNPSQPSEAVIYRDARWDRALFHLPFFAAFPVIGAALVFLPLRAFASPRRMVAAKVANPDSPERWRDDWANGFIRDEAIGRSAVWRGVLIWWTVASAAVFASLFVTGAWDRARVVATLFTGAIFLLMLVPTIQNLRTARKFGRLVFVPDSFHMVPGGTLSGLISLPKPLRQPHRVRARVEVDTHESGSFKTVAKITASVEVHPSGIVIDATLPEFPEAGPSKKRGSITWTLYVKASSDGLKSEFRLPVFAGSAGAGETLSH